jgi:hypothetical protein
MTQTSRSNQLQNRASALVLTEKNCGTGKQRARWHEREDGFNYRHVDHLSFLLSARSGK